MEMSEVREELQYLELVLQNCRPKERVTPGMIEEYLSGINRGESRSAALYHLRESAFFSQPSLSSRAVFCWLTALILIGAPLAITFKDVAFEVKGVVLEGFLRSGGAFFLLLVVFLVYKLLKSCAKEPVRAAALGWMTCLAATLIYVYSDLIDGRWKVPAWDLVETLHRAVMGSILAYGSLSLALYVTALVLSLSQIAMVAVAKRFFRDRLGKKYGK